MTDVRQPLHPLILNYFTQPIAIGLMLLLFLLGFGWASWESSRSQLFGQLDSMLPTLEANTRIIQQQTDHQLNELIQSARQNRLPWLEWMTSHQPPRSNYTHLALYDGNGEWIAGTLDMNTRIISHPPLSAADRLMLQQSLTTRFTATTNLQGGYYLSLCRQFTIAGTERFLCQLISSASDNLQGQSDLAHNVIGSRMVRSDGTLLMASRLSVHYREYLGQPLPEQLMDLLHSFAPGKINHFFNVAGIDNQQRLGVARLDDASAVVHVLTVPMSYLIRNWLSDAKWMFLLWLICVVAIWQLQQRHRPERHHRSGSIPADAATSGLAGSERLSGMMGLVQGAMYRLHLPEHRLEMLTSGDQDFFPADFSERPDKHSLLELVHPDDQQHYLDQLEQLTSRGANFEVVYRINTQLHEQRWLMDRGKVIQHNDAGTLIEGLVIDITEHILAQQHVEYLATRDPLTELMNRYYFNDELINTIDLLHQQHGQLALLFIDLDRFKTVNDSLGHQVGDRMLKLVAERLRHLVSSEDYVARLGGDEFIVMMINPENRDAIERLASSILSHLSTTYQLDYYRLTTTCSIGITLYPDDSEESYILLRNADTAMYTAKARGGNCYQFYTEEMNQQVNTRLTLESELRRAIKSQEFELYYQAQVTSEGNQLIGAEALIRWDHPTAGLVPPSEFVPIAEETGLIREIGDWALLEACRAFCRLNEEFGLGLTISVNVSVRQLNDLFVLRVQEILNQSGLAPEYLELEITESLLMHNVQENIRLLEAISQLGVRFAMDDFGTGYSSLSYLKQFPISKLKIDRAFINDINTDPDDEAIVRAIIAMAKSLHLELVAEGVENHQQLSMLRALECDCYQGYYFSHPLPLGAFHELLEKVTRNQQIASAPGNHDAG